MMDKYLDAFWSMMLIDGCMYFEVFERAWMCMSNGYNHESREKDR